MVAGAQHYEPGGKSSGQRSKTAEAARTQKTNRSKRRGSGKGADAQKQGTKREQQEQQNTGTKNK